MPCFAIVRDSIDLAATRRELSQMLRFRHRGLRRTEPDPLERVPH